MEKRCSAKTGRSDSAGNSRLPVRRDGEHHTFVEAILAVAIERAVNAFTPRASLAADKCLARLGSGKSIRSSCRLSPLRLSLWSKTARLNANYDGRASNRALLARLGHEDFPFCKTVDLLRIAGRRRTWASLG